MNGCIPELNQQSIRARFGGMPAFEDIRPGARLLMRVEGAFAHALMCVRKFFHREIGFAETAVVFDIGQLYAAGTPPS
jgi:hypothetical protein